MSSSAARSSSQTDPGPALILDNEDGAVLNGLQMVMGDSTDTMRHFGILWQFWVTEGI